MSARLYPEGYGSTSQLVRRASRIALAAAVALAALTAPALRAWAAGPKITASWRVAAGGELALNVDVERGWHLNAHDPDRPYLVPTTLDLDPPPGVAIADVHYPDPVVRSLGFAPDTELRLYEGPFTIRVRLSGGSGPPAKLGARLSYQACNDETCLPPATLAVPFEGTGTR